MENGTGLTPVCSVRPSFLQLPTSCQLHCNQLNAGLSNKPQCAGLRSRGPLQPLPDFVDIKLELQLELFCGNEHPNSAPSYAFKTSGIRRQLYTQHCMGAQGRGQIPREGLNRSTHHPQPKLLLPPKKKSATHSQQLRGAAGHISSWERLRWPCVST